MPMWIVLGAFAAGSLGISAAVFFGQRLASERADALRRAGDEGAANATDQIRVATYNPAALPMHVQGFDKPK